MLAPLARGDLFGAVVEVAGVERLLEAQPGQAQRLLRDRIGAAAGAARRQHEQHARDHGCRDQAAAALVTSRARKA